MTERYEALFWSRVRFGEDDECWPWTGHIKSGRAGGHGQVKVFGKGRGTHCVAWELHNGELLKPGDEVLHSCDNRPCCNPAHLTRGDKSANMKDMIAKGRGRGQFEKSSDGTDPQGHAEQQIDQGLHAEGIVRTNSEAGHRE